MINAVQSVYSFSTEIIITNTVKECDKIFQELLELDIEHKITLNEYLWDGSFSNARNFGIDKARYDWIFVIDSDEVIDKPIKNLDPFYDYYFVKIENFKNMFYDSIRIFKPGIRYRYNVHESLEEVCVNKKGCRSDAIIRHNGYNDNNLLSKAERNFNLMLKDYDNPVRNYHLAQYYFTKNKMYKALKHALKVLSDEVNEAHKANICNLIYMITGNVMYLIDSIKYVSNQITARILLVNELIEKQNYILASDNLFVLSEINEKKNSDIPNEIYLTNEFLNNKRKEITKWIH